MSRAAQLQSNKKEQKAAIAEKNAEKERLAALGMTPTIKKLIGADVVLCMECGATQMGPTVCECKAGRNKPGPDDEQVPHLIAALKGRQALVKADDRKANVAKQGEVAKLREKQRESKEADRNDLTLEVQGDGGVELLQEVEFPVGKLGMDIEGKAVCKISDAPSNASELGVKVGWAIHSVNGTAVGAKKAAIIKEVASCMKRGPVKFGFRVPIMGGYHLCITCDKFVETEKFDDEELSKGAGKHNCSECLEFADMGF